MGMEDAEQAKPSNPVRTTITGMNVKFIIKFFGQIGGNTEMNGGGGGVFT